MANVSADCFENLEKFRPKNVCKYFSNFQEAHNIDFMYRFNESRQIFSRYKILVLS